MSLRDMVFTALDEHCKKKDSGRFPKLLLRLPTLRSIALEIERPIFFYKVREKNVFFLYV